MSERCAKLNPLALGQFAVIVGLSLAGFPAHGHNIIGNVAPRNYESRTGAPGDRGAGNTIKPERQKLLSTLAEATSLTATGRLDDAEKAFRLAMDMDAETAAPPFARFLRLTGRVTDTASLTSSLVKNIPETSTTLRSRVMAAAGDTTGALLALIGGETTTALLQEPQAAVFAANLMTTLGQEEQRGLLLSDVAIRGQSQEVRRIAFRHLLTDAKSMAALSADRLIGALSSGLELYAATDPRSIAVNLDELILTVMMRPDYFPSRRSEIFMLAEDGPAAGTWLGARLLIREEKHAEALNWISSQEAGLRDSAIWPMIAFEKAVALSSLGRVTEAGPIYAAVAARTKGRTRLAALKEQARAAMASNDFSAAAEILAEVPVQELSADERKLYHLALVQVAVKRQDIPAIVDAYTSATVGLRNDDRAALHAAIFGVLIETPQHVELEEEVRRRLSANPKLPPTLWRLAAEAALASRRTPNRIEALYRLNLALPGDHESLKALAEAVSPVAAELAALPEGILAVPKAEILKLQELAKASLEATIRTHPLDPDNYKPLLAYHQAIGTTETTVAAAVGIVAKDSPLPQVKAAAAYALAINGYAEAALPLYDAALAISPDDMHIQMNRASCLTRLNRWDDALEFYYRILVEGYRNQAYHVHELVDRIWKIEKHLGRPDQCIKRFQEALGRIPPDRFTETVESMGILMLNESRWEDALAFFKRHQAETPIVEERGHAANFMGQVYMRSGRPAEAAKVYAEGAKANREFEELWVELMHGQAQALVQAGETDKALEVLRDTARELPDQPLASTSLFRAGQVLEQVNQGPKALEMYREFLKGSCGDVSLRAAAEERISDLSSAATPSQRP